MAHKTAALGHYISLRDAGRQQKNVNPVSYFRLRLEKPSKALYLDATRLDSGCPTAKSPTVSAHVGRGEGMTKKDYSLGERIGIAKQFQIPGEVYMVSPYGGGHINDTYAVETKTTLAGHRAMQRFLLQRIETDIFPRPRELMSNIQKVTEKQRESIVARGGDPLRESLTLVPAQDGNVCLEREEDRTFWRCYHFIEGACTHEFVRDDPSGRDLAYQAARAFGDFHLQLASLPGGELDETIRQFHHTPSRVKQLEDAIAADCKGRAEACREEIEFAGSLYPTAPVFVQAMENGGIPTRVSHNDTKINNIMFDFLAETEKALAIIDLDTVMPGTLLYDFGDLVRTSTWPGPEDERDFSGVYVSMELFESLVRGWVDGTGGIMTPAEISHLALAGKLITYTIGIRFLADHLRGDTYFSIQREGQNLDRARVQFAMIRSMEQQKQKMEKIVSAAAG